jgi:hypothetical protein
VSGRRSDAEAWRLTEGDEPLIEKFLRQYFGDGIKARGKLYRLPDHLDHLREPQYRDDFRQAAFEGFYRAMRFWDERKSTRATYAASAVAQALKATERALQDGEGKRVIVPTSPEELAQIMKDGETPAWDGEYQPAQNSRDIESLDLPVRGQTHSRAVKKLNPRAATKRPRRPPEAEGPREQYRRDFNEELKRIALLLEQSDDENVRRKAHNVRRQINRDLKRLEGSE